MTNTIPGNEIEIVIYLGKEERARLHHPRAQRDRPLRWRATFQVALPQVPVPCVGGSIRCTYFSARSMSFRRSSVGVGRGRSSTTTTGRGIGAGPGSMAVIRERSYHPGNWGEPSLKTFAHRKCRVQSHRRSTTHPDPKWA